MYLYLALHVYLICLFGTTHVTLFVYLALHV